MTDEKAGLVTTETVQEEGMRFDALKSIVSDGVTARLGRLALPRRDAIDTPNFLAVTSRGVLPHLTPDNMSRYASFPGVYMAMEDCELPRRRNPPPPSPTPDAAFLLCMSPSLMRLTK